MIVAQRSMQYNMQTVRATEKKHITGACDITEEWYGTFFTTERKRAGHSAFTFRDFVPRLELLTLFRDFLGIFVIV